MNYKSILAELIKNSLNTLEGVSSWRASDRFRIATFNAESRRDRIAVMGDPTRYVEVLDASTDTEPGELLGDGTPAVRSHTVNVSIWYHYKDSDNYTNSSQSVWDAVINNGLLRQLSELSHVDDDDGNVIYISRPLNVQFQEVALSGTGDEFAHSVTFQITFS